MPSTKTFEPDQLPPLDPGFERWHNNRKGRVVLIRLGEYGRKTEELIPPGKDFLITPAERRANQVAAATPAQDMFTNGALSPLQLIEGEPDTLKLLANPNTITVEDIHEIFRNKGTGFLDKIAEITSVNTIDRLLEAAQEPANRVLVEQFQALQVRRANLVAADARVEISSSNGQKTMNPVTPR